MTDLTTYSEDPISEKTSFLSRPLVAALQIDWEKAIYLLFIAIAIVSRFWGVGDRAMSHDESLHTQFSYQFYRGDGFSHTPLMHGPFLFHATALSYWLFGHSDYAARIPAAFLGVLLVALPYLLRPYFGRVGSLFISFIFLISPYLLYYSRYIREDIFAIIGYLSLFIFIWYYLDRRQEKYLWFFAAALSFLFTTKEISFFYVAIFGSFLVLRLVPQMVTAEWFGEQWRQLLRPLFVLLFGVVLLGSGGVGYLAASPDLPDVGAVVDEALVNSTTAVASSAADTAFRWLVVAGVFVAGLGLFLGAQALRPFIDHYPEFDLIILFSTLILPFIAPVFMVIVGWDPVNYNSGNCLVAGEDAMSTMQLFMERLFSGSWWGCVMDSGLMRIFFFLGISLLISTLVGMWWNGRRWLITAVIFYSIFLLFYTSLFTNFGGIVTGMSGSLGYWLEQQEVQRGSQPWFYYFVVMPFYEYLSVIFSLLAIGYWLKKERLHKVFGYWLAVMLLPLFAYTFTNWLLMPSAAIESDGNTLPGVIAALVLFVLGVVLWFALVARRLRASYELEEGSLWQLWQWRHWIGLVPFLSWWLLLTWAAFSYAGEKMPWLSTHFVIPMALLIGWYFNEKLRPFTWRHFWNKTSGQLFGLTIVLLVAVSMTIGPVLLGEVRFGNQESDNLSNIGRLIGSLLMVGLLLYLWLQVRERLADGRLRRLLYMLSIFAILSFITVRAAYVASFPNADYVREFLVYAHGAPAIKNIVLAQVDELSQRLHGDNSIRVAYGGDGVPWPFTWYMRQYPNNTYFAESPTADLQDVPVIIVGGSSWSQLDSVLGGSHRYTEYTYMWWPMEDYRQINWSAILGDPNTPEGTVRRGLFNADVRQAIWDIWFHRRYDKYDEVFNKNHSDGQWPLRDDLRLYIRNDVVNQMWDRGMLPTAVEPVEVAFTDNQFTIEPSLVIHAPGFPGAGPGELLAPRDVAVAADGTIFVLDSGNQRVQRFAADGALLDSWGEAGSGPGQFSADGQGPWGIAVDETHVYVADTWNHRIQKFTYDGTLVDMFGGAGNIAQMDDAGLGYFFGPRDISFLADGRLLITDTGNHRVQIMDTDGNFVDQIGGANGLAGAGLGLFYEPVGVAVDPFGFLYVTDTWNGRVQQFMPQLLPVQEWAIDHWKGNSSVNNKPYIAADSAGRIYVSDPENYRILIFSSTGDYLGKVGQFGTDINSLMLPTGLFIDAQDNLYVADAGNNRVLKYAPVFGPPPSFDLPEEPIDEEEDAALEETLPTDADVDNETDDALEGDTEGEIEGNGVPQTESGEPTAVGEEESAPEPTPPSD